MIIKIFGKLTDLFEATEYKASDDIKDTRELKSQLEESFPELKGMTYFIVVNGKKADQNINLPKDVEIALLPPYSGG
ncbi:MoaD/ThiS family protein [Chryseobacterium sp.]|uniref:MoaD/ThiS family protein n=1 Tax=Chryseobacterium sp. TaxID=1871047 RepID=UPI0025C151AA|nr:MoaD/ThiS family protein [Chryseobacterium sp.]